MTKKKVAPETLPPTEEAKNPPESDAGPAATEPQAEVSAETIETPGIEPNGPSAVIEGQSPPETPYPGDTQPLPRDTSADIITLTADEAAAVPLPSPSENAVLFKAPGGGFLVYAGIPALFPEPSRTFVLRDLSGVEAWLEMPPPDDAPRSELGDPLLMEGFPTSQYALGLLGIPEPPGGAYADVYAIAAEPEAIRASTMAGLFAAKAPDWKWQRLIVAGEGPAPEPWAEPAERPDSEVSVRILRMRQKQRGE